MSYLWKFCEQEENKNDNEKSGRPICALPPARRFRTFAHGSAHLANAAIEGNHTHVSASGGLNSCCCCAMNSARNITATAWVHVLR